jgi:NADPH:quinone reductase
MHAWRVHEFGHYRERLRWEACDVPEPSENGVVVAVRAAGLNFPDLLSIAGKYQVKAPLPFTPGLEAAGVVTAAGPRSRFRVGQRLIANNLWGAFAEQMAAPDASCFPIPDGMSDADAAALLVIYQTSYFALVHRTTVVPGEFLLVHGGAGGVGTSAIQIGKALGAVVIATAGSEEKLRICREAGADHVINHTEADFVEEVGKITRGHGADIVYDPVGGDTFDRSIKCLAFSGRLLVIGFTSGRIPEIKANRILLKNIGIIGVHWGAYQFHQPALIGETHEALCKLYAAGKIKPVLYRELPIGQLPDAMAALESRASYGKIVLRT